MANRFKVFRMTDNIIFNFGYFKWNDVSKLRIVGYSKPNEIIFEDI